LALTILPAPQNIKDPIWITSAQNLLAGYLLHYFSAGLTFIEAVDEILSKPSDLHLKYVCEVTTVPAVKRYLNQMMTLKTETFGGIYLELANKLMIFVNDERLRNALSKTDLITPEDLERGISIFLNISEDKIDPWRPLVTMILNQFFKYFERRPDKNSEPVLFVFEEAPRFGKVEPVITDMPTLRSKNITMALIIQSSAQLDLIYGPAQREVIFDNCSYKAILGASDAGTQEIFSRLVGTTEIIQTGQSTSYTPDRDEERGYTVSQHTAERRVILPMNSPR
jgi:type IV secretory pathway TraG/TraD family ATPase VirD4